jgi:hypothetical protein
VDNAADAIRPSQVFGLGWSVYDWQAFWARLPALELGERRAIRCP